MCQQKSAFCIIPEGHLLLELSVHNFQKNLLPEKVCSWFSRETRVSWSLLSTYFNGISCEISRATERMRKMSLKCDILFVCNYEIEFNTILKLIFNDRIYRKSNQMNMNTIWKDIEWYRNKVSNEIRRFDSLYASEYAFLNPNGSVT